MSKKNFIRLTYIGDARGLKKATAEAEHSLAGLGKRGGFSLAALGKAGMLAGTALATGVAFGLDKSVKAAMEFEVSQKRLRAQLHASGISWKAHGKEINDTLKSQERLSAFTRIDLQDSFTTLARATGDSSKALKLNALAQDVARGKGIDLQTSTMLVVKANMGLVGLLRRQGIDIKPVTKAYDELTASGGKLTKAQKDAAKAADLVATKHLAVATLQQKFGGQAKAYGDTTAGAFARVHNAVHELEISLGTALLPTVTKVAQAAADFIPKLEAWAHELSEKLSPAFHAIGDYVSGTLVPLLERIWPVVQRIASGFISWWVANIFPIFKGLAEIAAAAAGKIVAVFQAHKAQLKQIFDNVKLILTDAWAVIKPILMNVVLPILRLVFVQVLPRLIAGAIEAITLFTGAIAGIAKIIVAIKGKFVAFWGWLRDSALNAVLAIVEPFSHLPGGLGAWARRAKDAVNAQLDQIHPPKITLTVTGGQFTETIKDRHGHKDVITGNAQPFGQGGLRRAGGGRIPGTATPADSVPAMLSPGEFVVTGGGERLLETMTFPGVLNWLQGVQPRHFAFGGRVASSMAGMMSPIVTSMTRSPELLKGFADSANFGAPVGGGGPVPSGSVRSWLTQALKITGMSGSRNLSDLYQQTMHESGGNPRAINLWDSNAKAGHPSKGLLQTIDSTFASYSLPGHKDIWNPIDNAIAAVRYMVAKYGSIDAATRQRGFVGYRAGGRVRRRRARPHHGRRVPGGNASTNVTLPASIRLSEATARLTPTLTDDIAAKQSEIAWISDQLRRAKPGSERQITLVGMLADARDELKNLQTQTGGGRGGGGGGTDTADLEAKLQQANARLAVAQGTIALDEGFIRATGGGGSASASVGGATPTIVIQSLFPPTPEQARQAGAAAAEGAGYQPYRTTSSEKLGV